MLVCSAAVFAVLVLLWRRRERPTTAAPSRLALVCAALALGVAGVSGAVNVSQHSAHLLVDGDPAVYGATGKLLAREGALVLPTYKAELYGSNPTINFAGSGFYESDDETIYPQFLHLLPVLLAVADWIGGTSLLLVVNPVLGALSLLAFYCFAARLTRPPWALVATTALAALLPQVHFSRDMFSELPSQLLVFAGLAMLWDVSAERRRVAAPLVAGLVLGGSALARGDAFLYLVPLAAALLLVRAGRAGWAVLVGA
ncbi:MAG: hypothetical protein JWM62_2092, partial [Frankiales bacterium]|nr:hypothetical protein [Frankiales bacterium]